MNYTVTNQEFKNRIGAADAVDYNLLDVSARYEICEGEELLSFYERDTRDFFGVCRYCADRGFELYSRHEINGNQFATYFKGKNLVHVYWIECERELNVALSATGGEALPHGEITDTAKYVPSVTQIRSDKANGMGYVVQLSDGSFVVYDGGYRQHAEHLWETLARLNGSEENIVIRAWVITHAHGDHYPCFIGFAENYAEKVKLETFIMSPVNIEDTPDKYLNERVFDDVEKFDGARILYAHTGMLLRYGDVSLEILFTADELYIEEANRIAGIKGQKDLNSSSLVSRVFTAEKSCIFLGDAYSDVTLRMLVYYGKYLRSDMCQASHHGLETCPMLVYRHIAAQTMFYPCSEATYWRIGKDLSRYENVRLAIRKSERTKEIILHDKADETRYLKEDK